MKLKHLWKAAGLVALSAILILTLCLAGLLALVLRSAQITQFWNAPLTKLSQSLVLEEGRYHFTGEDLLAQQDLWLMLVGRDGQVLWQYNKPAEVPDQYDLLDVAAFTRWYLEDYPVQTRIRPDGLLVAGAPKGSTWKLTISLSEQILHLLPVWGVLLFFLSLICVLALAALLLRRWFRQDQQARDEARSDWINGISHDIRTPLNGILGLIEIEELREGDMQVARESRAKGRVAANHLLSLINDILEMGRIEECKVTLEHESFNLKELCDDALVLCKLRASDRGITMLDTSEPYAVDQYMIGSPTHIRQILVNLLDNSIKYNKHGGTVTFSSTIKPVDDEHAVFCFSVSDTGIGMTSEFLAHIYEPFAQEGDDARSKFQGTGIGMSIVKSLIDMMGGTIEISSEVGVGSTFDVRIPLDIDKNPQIKECADTQVSSCSLAGMNVLLAEDNELNAEIAQALLESEGIVVTRAADGNETVDLYVGRPTGSFDAILMDIMMPGMDGYEATRAIRLSEKADAADIPIIALTANAFAEDAKAAHDAGMNAHLPKPLDFSKLKNILACIKKNGAVSL